DSDAPARLAAPPGPPKYPSTSRYSSSPSIAITALRDHCGTVQTHSPLGGATLACQSAYGISCTGCGAAASGLRSRAPSSLQSSFTQRSFSRSKAGIRPTDGLTGAPSANGLTACAPGSSPRSACTSSEETSGLSALPAPASVVDIVFARGQATEPRSS